MVKEVTDFLNLQDGQTIVDGTLGLGGYTEAALRSGKKLKIIAFDLDRENMVQAKKRLTAFEQQVTYVHNNFAEIKTELKNLKVQSIDGLMLDLGLASTQVDRPERGFAFSKEGPLDMRFNQEGTLTAAQVINTYSLEQLTAIFREYGEEKAARRIANAIVTVRQKTPIETTRQLADLIEGVAGRKKTRLHPATKVFQALRIEVNGELENLRRVLADSLDLLSARSRLAVVSYHSLEDRIVKNFFRDGSREFINVPGELTTRHLQPQLKIITKKPLTPSAEEVAKNPRARSAKLRVAEKI